MNTNIIGIVLSFSFIFIVLALVTVSQKKANLGEEFSRKAIHIAVGNWILIAVYFFDSILWAAFVPLCFIVLNYISYMKQLFKAMERSADDSLGTVWYAVSLFVLTVVAFYLNMPFIAIGGILSMAYGDGFAAVIGSKWGNVTYPEKFGKKSLEGAVTVFIFIFLITSILAYLYLPVNSLLVGLVCGSIGTILELLTPNGFDNLSVPLSIGALLYLFTIGSTMTGLILNTTLTICILFLAWVVGALTAKSCVTSFILGMSLYLLGGWLVYAGLIVFAILGSGISKIGRQKKLDAAALHEREGTRGSVQVLANGLPALFFAIIYFVTQVEAFQLAALTTFAAANADTFSSEIGMISQKNPISILTFKRLAKGLSGGVSFLGLISGLIGALLIGSLALGSYPIRIILLISLIGFCGTLIDSILGSTLQAKYQIGKKITEQTTENGQKLKRISGYSVINNDVVNFISVLLTGILACFVFN
ncbi:DUF92 domain-containing protein [Carnobacterium maltaromaticum]|uniref:DUF92 domain-containing protein n=1 Tax=Carnobacterium maltaromaticum TaxID=2751 RepID=UPI0028EC74D2|nr:DUF92 domain-containing protein [Carnobacterium maltaromaticum]